MPHMDLNWLAVQTRAAFGLVTILLIASSTQAAEVGQPEKQWLHDAARGNYQNVFLVRMFDSFVAFPRTFVQAGVGPRSKFLVDMLPDASLDGGEVRLGTFRISNAGKRMDYQTATELPAQPSRTEQRGKLTIEYFDPGSDGAAAMALIRDDAYYIWLFGSAVVLTEDLVNTEIALAGPPDKIMSRLAQASDTSPSGRNARALDDQAACDANTFRASSVVSTTAGHTQILIRVQSGAHPEAFQQTGFVADDLIVAIDGRPVRLEDDLHRLMRDAARGQPIKFTVKRGTSSVDIAMPAATARRALGDCFK